MRRPQVAYHLYKVKNMQRAAGCGGPAPTQVLGPFPRSRRSSGPRLTAPNPGAKAFSSRVGALNALMTHQYAQERITMRDGVRTTFGRSGWLGALCQSSLRRKGRQPSPWSAELSRADPWAG